MKEIKTIGVVGAGTMGSALAQRFTQSKFNVVLIDRDLNLVKKGMERIIFSFNEALEKKIFTSEQTDKFISGINATTDFNFLSRCDIIIEAVFEDFNVKADLFKQVSNIVPKETIIATNTSSFSVNELSQFVDTPERFIGLHFFYHAAKNRLVEIIPGNKTSKQVIETIKLFTILSGKDAIFTLDKYGFAVNRFFVPWLNEAVRILEERIAEINEIEIVCQNLFGIGMGPFALMNATGVKIAYHAQQTLEVLGNFYKTSDLLKQQADSGESWKFEIPDNFSVPTAKEKVISDRMFGAVFLVSSQILEEKVCSATDLNRGAKIGLKRRKGPVDLMGQCGADEVNRIVKLIADKHKVYIPSSIADEFWKLNFVTLEKINSNVIITINRPEDLNALNEKVIHQLEEKFNFAENDSSIENIFLVGSGKAFVAGADIKFFIDNMKKHTLDNIVSFTKYGQDVLNKIESSKKKVVAILNGLTLGGGLELALTADIILAVDDAALSFPETGIGIYPGLGGTQRTPKRIGNGFAKYLIYTGKMISTQEAFEVGIVDGVINNYTISELLNGQKSISDLNFAERKVSDKLKNIDKFFETNTVDSILNGTAKKYELTEDEVQKFSNTLKRKAPVALKTAEQLINNAEGVEAELKQLKMIFSTSDAMLGLTSIGKKVVFEGK